MEATGTASDYRHRRFRNGANGTYRFQETPYPHHRHHHASLWCPADNTHDYKSPEQEDCREIWWKNCRQAQWNVCKNSFQRMIHIVVCSDVRLGLFASCITHGVSTNLGVSLSTPKLDLPTARPPPYCWNHSNFQQRRILTNQKR